MTQAPGPGVGVAVPTPPKDARQFHKCHQKVQQGGWMFSRGPETRSHLWHDEYKIILRSHYTGRTNVTCWLSDDSERRGRTYES